ncbi:MAG: alpha/beta hydrolase [bacterium]
MTLTTLILPGISNSGPEHWQSYWERADPQCRRVLQMEWERPRCADWVATLDHAVATTPGEIVLVAHSSACALIAHWAPAAAADRVERVRGALLVGPSDPDGPNYPVGPSGFAPMPLLALPFPTTVVASQDDVFVTLERAKSYARAWGSTFVDIGAAGHINSATNLGAWPAGYALLEALRADRRT